MQGLDERLAAVAAFVPLGARLADIGADHAKLPLALAAKEKIARAIAVDVNEGPFEAARRAVRAAGMAQLVEVRLGDGLAALAPGEVDAVAVAGDLGIRRENSVEFACDAGGIRENFVSLGAMTASFIKTGGIDAGWSMAIADYCKKARGKK